MHACNRFFLPGEQVNACNRGNRRQRFPTETQCADCRKVVLASQLARCVTPERNRRILRRHAAAVIGNSQIGNAAIFNFYRDARRTRIYRILDQFLGDRGRPFYHLARRDQVGQVR